MKIISGGQTGVDQAALHAAIDLNIPHGGWCPPGRACESGIIPDIYNMQETPAERSDDAPDIPRSQRTLWNVRDADGTLILLLNNEQAEDRGTVWTIQAAKNLNKPFQLVDLSKEADPEKINKWIRRHRIRVLNVGGPSEKSAPGIANATYQFIRIVLENTLKSEYD